MTPGGNEAPRALARIDSVNVGLPRPARLPADFSGSGDGNATYLTAIAKAAVAGPVAVSAGGLRGDAQADRRNHGGPDKAVHAHFARHLAWWGELRGFPIQPGEIGENLTLGAPPGEGAPDETAFCIGDILAVGAALLQVTQPRIPCFKQAAALCIPDAVRRAAETGRTGMYLRILREGALQAADLLRLVERPNPDVTVADANRFIHRARHDAELRERLAACTGLGAEVRRRLPSAPGL